MKRYAILMVLAAMLCGTEARATPSISYQTFDTGPGHLITTHSLTGNLDLTKNVSSDFRTFGFNPSLVLNDPNVLAGQPGLLVSHVNISIFVPIFDVGANINFYIDNIKVEADIQGAPTQNIGFGGLGEDGGVFTANLLEVKVPGTDFDTFEVRGVEVPWAVSPIGNTANSLFVGSVLAGGTAHIEIWRPDRYTQNDVDSFLQHNAGSLVPFKVGDKKGADAGASFFFHSADLKFVTSQTDPNGGNVPEPASLLLLGAGLAGIGIWRRKARG